MAAGFVLALYGGWLVKSGGIQQCDLGSC
uniref:Uncharacterized protein n=1 Tax=Arundo donax TaxID=35708 RepID=A0A0A8ZIK8_ARUDO